MADSTAYLDIETSWSGEITVIGVYRPGVGTAQLVAPKVSFGALRELLDGATRIATYNGARFDLPVIHRRAGLRLLDHCEHWDLMRHCWRHPLKGGLKKVERTLGIHRDTEGIDGLAALRLWQAHQAGDALRRLEEHYPERLKKLKKKVRKEKVHG